ncbi:MAG: hypothetical protein ACXWBM_01225 [Chthoniobacterales bacterium]
MTAQTLTTLLLASICLLCPSQLKAIGFGQVDTFQDGTTMGWGQGPSSTTTPTNIPSGGPAGAGDNYLETVSIGGGSASSRMIVFNENQWTGDYVSAGMDRITAHMANFGSDPLYMRVTLSSANGTLYSSTSAAILPADGIWRVLDFDLTTSALTNLGGSETVAQALSHVTQVRVLSAFAGPSFRGDTGAGVLGTDNIIGHDIANFVLRVTQIALVSGVPRVSFTTVAGRPHRVEQRSSLTTGTWSTVTNAGNITGTGGIVQVDDTDPGAGSQPSRFYRVVLLPPS